MKHVRIDADTTNGYCDMLADAGHYGVALTLAGISLGWRREYAARVFQAIQAVVMVAVVDELRFMCDRRESGSPWDDAAAVLKGPKP